MSYSELERERDQHEVMRQEIEDTRGLEAEAPSPPAPSVNVLQMHKDLRSWAITSLVLGVLSIFASGTFDPVWGIMMIVIAILAWRIRLPAMLALYAVVMGWAALTNGLSVLYGGDIVWLGATLLQVYWVYSILRRWKQYSRVPLEDVYASGAWPTSMSPPQQESVITGQFAVAGFILALFALILLPSTFVVVVLYGAITQSATTPPLLLWLLSGAVDIGVMALGLSLAGRLSRNERRGWGTAGIVVSAVVLVGWLLLVLL